MNYTQIYKIKIAKATKKLYDLGGKELIALQVDYIKLLTKIAWEDYETILSELEKNPEVKYNDLYIDQSKVKKGLGDFFDAISGIISSAFQIGAVELNKDLKDEVKVETSFNISDEETLAWAEEFAGKRITGIDEYTKKRVNKLITTGIEKGWGYGKLAKALKKDYAFSTYRARLIASNEIGEAYINGKNEVFKKATSEYGEKGWKKWIAHNDDRTTEGCRTNHSQEWIEFDQEFKSGHMTPPRFPWCRCNIVYRLFDPNEK